jgi:hypothetical protein
MKALIVAVHSAVREHYERTKPWGVDFVKFMIDFNEHGRIVEISYTPPIPEEYEAALVDRVRPATRQRVQRQGCKCGCRIQES